MMGAAVLNGGTTTFLAVILLSDSTSHGLITFFKVFFLTVLFGLFHAIAFLPVVLRLELPSALKCNKEKEQNEEQVHRSKAKKFVERKNSKEHGKHVHKNTEEKFVERKNSEENNQQPNNHTIHPFVESTNNLSET